MTTIVESSNSTTLSSLRKRYREDDDIDTNERSVRPRGLRYFFRLASDSSPGSADDTESVYSYQDRETDVVVDTSDTSDSTGAGADEYELEYELASSTDGEIEHVFSNSSDGAEDIVLAAVAGAIIDTSLEPWITDCEDSDNSSLEDISLRRSDFSTCLQCKLENDNPLFRYCDKCFQSCKQCKKRKTYKCFPLCNSCYKDRKKFFPPRPRKKKDKSKKAKVPPNPVKLDTLRSCLNVLSQDSGIGSSQECPHLDIDQIVVPKHLTPGTSQNSTIVEKKLELEDCDGDIAKAGSSEIKSPDSLMIRVNSSSSENALCSERTSKDIGSNGKTESDTSELCIFCNSAPKDSIFLHTNYAHRCCCYSCAKRTVHQTNRCPICNGTVSKVLRIYTA